MSENPNAEFNKIVTEREVESSWAELQRSEEYAREELYPTEMLEQRGKLWLAELDNPSRSERSKQDILTITKRIGAELYFRRSKDAEANTDTGHVEYDEEILKELELAFSE